MLAGLALLGACSLPVGVRRVDPRTVHRTLTGGVLTTGALSAPTQNVLFRWGLGELVPDHAEVALGVLHAALLEERAGQDEIFALAELSFEHAERSGLGSYYLATVVYTYLFLFPEDWSANPNPFDSRLRLAADLYNRAITAGLAARDRHLVAIESGTYDLPFGTLEVELDPADLRWGNRLLNDFVPVAELAVHGMRTRYRWPGLGAPLAAGTAPLEPGKDFDDFVEPWVKVPVSAVLRMERLREQIETGRVRGQLTLEFSQDTEFITVEGRYLPLEVESTATLAYMLAESPVWTQELAGFLKGFGVIDTKSQLAALEPYRVGRIPVVFVHGTASSAGRWAQMMNELYNDPRIRGKFQFWLFSYNTGNPIGYSAMLLREALTAAVQRLDPGNRDPALHRMVVIGHSQGGLLTKMTAVDSGSQFWDDVSRTPLSQLTLSDRTRALLERAMFVRPLPFVRRLVFVATPQRGSYFAGNRLSHWVARFITFPVDLVHVGTDLLVRNRQAIDFASFGHIPSAVENMTPGNRFIKTLAALPVAPGVASHSIIAVTGEGAFEDGDDGIVEYRSAHLDDTVSELVVRTSHSCQAVPETIEEVRRILLLHLEESGAEN